MLFAIMDNTNWLCLGPVARHALAVGSSYYIVKGVSVNS